jgi:hypothetical protein
MCASVACGDLSQERESISVVTIMCARHSQALDAAAIAAPLKATLREQLSVLFKRVLDAQKAAAAANKVGTSFELSVWREVQHCSAMVANRPAALSGVNADDLLARRLLVEVLPASVRA